MDRRVDRSLTAGLMHQPEPTPDHRVADLADRQRPRHRARPPQPQQTVGAGELVDGGPAFHAGHAVPQGQSLRVPQQIPDAACDDQPLTQRAAVSLNLGLIRRRDDDRPSRQQVPRPLAGLRMGGVLVVDGQLVADLPGGDQLATRRGLDKRDHPATARGSTRRR